MTMKTFIQTLEIFRFSVVTYIIKSDKSTSAIIFPGPACDIMAMIKKESMIRDENMNESVWSFIIL